MCDERALQAAGNNADWYEAVFQIHGLKYQRLPFAFVAEDAPPPYYSKLTVLAPDHDKAVLSKLADLARRFDGAVGVKDSFCQLDLSRHGFAQRFAATWIWRAPRQTALPSGWKVVTESDELALWEDGWNRNGSPVGRRLFQDGFLSRDVVSFLGRKTGARFTAGCIANRSGNCIGLSNVFAEAPSPEMFSQAADAVSAVDGDVPVVGYERGSELEHAISAGFEAVGQLRVLGARHATF